MATGRPRFAAARRTVRRRLAPPRGAQDRPAPRGRRPRRRTGLSNRPSRSFVSRIRRTAASSAASLTAPVCSASGRCAYAGSDIAISISTPAEMARAAASVRVGSESVRDEIAHGVRVADHESRKAHASRSTSVNSHRVADAGIAVEVHVCGHDVARARPQRRR